MPQNSSDKFVVTDESQRLARWLRLMGYDTVVVNAEPLSELYRRAYEEGRTIVTRNRRIMPSSLFRVIRIDERDLPSQLRHLMVVANLQADDAPAFSRCDRCNDEVQPVEKADVQALVPPHVFRTQQNFRACPVCYRVYWAATHHERITAFLQRIAKG